MGGCLGGPGIGYGPGYGGGYGGYGYNRGYGYGAPAAILVPAGRGIGYGGLGGLGVVRPVGFGGRRRCWFSFFYIKFYLFNNDE